MIMTLTNEIAQAPNLRGVKYHVALSSAMFVRHTFHGITFCGMKITGLFLFADLQNNLNIPQKLETSRTLMQRNQNP